MDFLRRRELVGLLGLAVGLVVMASFLAPSDNSGAAPRPVSMGVGLPASPTPSPAPIPATPLPGARLWALRYFSIEGNQQTERMSGAVEELDLTFGRSPGPDLADDAWKVEASATIQAPAGRYSFTVEHQNDVHVFVDGREIASQASDSSPQSLVVTFDHRGRNPIRVRVEARDVGGPFILRLRAGD
jgi:hypothetical protein